MATEAGRSTSDPQFAHLSIPDPDWLEVAAQQEALDKLADERYNLPIAEFRKVPYRPPPLPKNAPTIGKDIAVDQEEIAVRDGAKIGIRIYHPIDDETSHLLFFNIHGGGWTVGTPETEEAQNRLVAAKNHAVVVGVDYRRAPEHPFPYALHDAQDALLWCKQNFRSLRINPESIIVGGGSAGANIAAVLAHIARDGGITGIIGQILNIPVTCHPDYFPISKHEYLSFDQNAGAPIVNARIMRKFWSNYLPTGDSNPLSSPLLAKSFARLPPALLQVAGMDPLRDEGLAYAQELQASGVDVVLKIYGGLPHAFYIYPDLPASVQYFQSVVDWIEQLCKTRQPATTLQDDRLQSPNLSGNVSLGSQINFS